VLVFVLGGLGLSLALLAVYRQNKYAMCAFIVAGIASVAYFIYRLVRIAQPRPAGNDPYEHTRQFLIFTTVITLVLILITLGVACKCFWDVYNDIKIFTSQTKTNTNNKVYGKDGHAPIDNESTDHYELYEGGQNNASKTLLEQEGKPSTASNPQQNNMWTIE
jgi:heme/copper-type cytochrome/quinol oxidase subunit 2